MFAGCFCSCVSFAYELRVSCLPSAAVRNGRTPPDSHQPWPRRRQNATATGSELFHLLGQFSDLVTIIRRRGRRSNYLHTTFTHNFHFFTLFWQVIKLWAVTFFRQVRRRNLKLWRIRYEGCFLRRYEGQFIEVMRGNIIRSKLWGVV